ncbi:hypothetical protein ACE6H2_018393 [Prunus campanulata]
MYVCSDMHKANVEHDATGKLLKFDPQTKEVTVLLRGLSLPLGTAVSKHGLFVLVSECTLQRIQKFWLTGPKANTSEIIHHTVGYPVNRRRRSNRDFWVAANR